MNILTWTQHEELRNKLRMDELAKSSYDWKPIEPRINKWIKHHANKGRKRLTDNGNVVSKSIV